MNKYFTEKTDGKDDVFAEDFNNAFDSVETDMNARQKISEKNVADGYAGLDSTGKINKEQIPETTASDVPYNGTESGLSALNVQSAIDELAADYEQGKVENDNRYLPQDTAAGTEPQTECALAANAINYQVYGNSVQDGTPTPESPVEIQSVGDLVTSGEYAGKYDVPVTVRGKNLLHSNVTTLTSGGVTLTYDNGVITLNGTCTKSVNFELFNIALSANTYTLSANANKVPVNNIYAFVQLYDSKNNQIIEIANKNAQGYATVTTSVDGTFAYRVRAAEGCVYNNVILKPQLEIGSTATAYEPYFMETKHYYLDEPLRKVGDYADYIDYEKQKVVRKIKYIRLEPTLDYKIWTYNDVLYGFNVNLTKSIQECMVLSNYFKPVTDNKLPSNKDNSIYLRRVLYIGTADWTTVDDFKAWLSDNITYVAYVLKTPTEESITLAPMPLGAGTNNITTGTAVKPSNVIVDYYQKPYIPQKGVDYYTEAEKQEIIQEIKLNVTGDIETALDDIIAIQNSLIGGDTV